LPQAPIHRCRSGYACTWQLRLIGPDTDHTRRQPSNRLNGRPEIDKSLESLRTLTKVKLGAAVLPEQPGSSRVRSPSKQHASVTMSTKRTGAEPDTQPLVRDDDDVRAWIVIGLIAFACLLVGWLPMLSAIGT
jgi:hypothetical protein